jgi:hypothetical protein
MSQRTIIKVTTTITTECYIAVEHNEEPKHVAAFGYAFPRDLQGFTHTSEYDWEEVSIDDVPREETIWSKEGKVKR